jgi:hypothetical protein
MFKFFDLWQELEVNLFKNGWRYNKIFTMYNFLARF